MREEVEARLLDEKDWKIAVCAKSGWAAALTFAAKEPDHSDGKCHPSFLVRLQAKHMARRESLLYIVLRYCIIAFFCCAALCAAIQQSFQVEKKSSCCSPLQRAASIVVCSLLRSKDFRRGYC